MSSPTGVLQIQIVDNARLRDEVFRLRYRAYHNEGEIAESRSGIFADEYDDAPNQISWALSLDGTVVGTLRSMFYHSSMKRMLPEHKVFGDIIPKVIPQETRVISGNRFAIEPSMKAMGKRLTFLLLKHHMTVALVKGDWGLAAVKKHHMPFYRRVMQLEAVSEPRYYDEMNSGFTLMATNVLDSYSTVCMRHPSLRSTTGDLALLKQIPASFDTIEESDSIIPNTRMMPL